MSLLVARTLQSECRIEPYQGTAQKAWSHVPHKNAQIELQCTDHYVPSQDEYSPLIMVQLYKVSIAEPNLSAVQTNKLSKMGLVHQN